MSFPVRQDADRIVKPVSFGKILPEEQPCNRVVSLPTLEKRGGGAYDGI